MPIILGIFVGEHPCTIDHLLTIMNSIIDHYTDQDYYQNQLKFRKFFLQDSLLKKRCEFPLPFPAGLSIKDEDLKEITQEIFDRCGSGNKGTGSYSHINTGEIRFEAQKNEPIKSRRNTRSLELI